MSDVLVFDTDEKPQGEVVELVPDVMMLDTPVEALHLEELASGDFLLFDAPEPEFTTVQAPQDFLLIDAPAAPNTLVGEADENILVITTSGPRGLTGAPGAPGAAGAPGTAGAGAGGGSYSFVQAAPLAEWDITHALTYVPNVFVVDNSGAVLVGDMDVVDATHIRLLFSVPISGTAYLS